VEIVESCGLPDREKKEKKLWQLYSKKKKHFHVFSHCFWSNLTKKFSKNFPKSETFAE
jgi:hypothetical protein